MGRLPEEVSRDLRWVADGVALVPGADPGAASLLIDDGDVMLVDAGLTAEMRKRLTPHVDVLFLTHYHVHHTFGARDFREVWVPREEAGAFEGTDGYMQVAGVAPRDRPLYEAWLHETGYEPCGVAKRYRSGGLLRFGRHEWHILSAPGHSPGHTVLYDEEREILFSADLDSDPHALWYGDPASDLDELERTAEELRNLDVRLLLTSHGPPRKRAASQVFADAAHKIRERDRRLLAFCDRPRSMDDLVRMGFITHPETPIDRYFERIMVEKHVGRLLERDYLAARQDGRYERAM